MTTVWIPDAITYKRYHCIVDNSDIIWCSSLISTALPVLSKIFNKHPFILECRKIITPGITFKEVWFLLVTSVAFFRVLFSQITMLSSSVFDFSCLYVDIIGLTIFSSHNLNITLRLFHRCYPTNFLYECPFILLFLIQCGTFPFDH